MGKSSQKAVFQTYVVLITYLQIFSGTHSVRSQVHQLRQCPEGEAKNFFQAACHSTNSMMTNNFHMPSSVSVSLSEKLLPPFTHVHLLWLDQKSNCTTVSDCQSLSSFAQDCFSNGQKFRENKSRNCVSAHTLNVRQWVILITLLILIMHFYGGQ